MTSLWRYVQNNDTQIAHWAGTTVWLALLPLVIALALALPTGWLAAWHRIVYPPLIGVTGVLYTIPSLVLFLILPTILGTRILDPINVAIALTIYAYALLVRSVADALGAVPADLLEAGSAMGQTDLQRLLSLQLPMAIPVIAAGVRVAAVSNVSLISVASVIGVPQLGQLFTLGDNTESLVPIVLGLIFFVVLALLIDGIVLGLERLTTPWRRAVAS
ncbi:MAG: ABC transporter permease subunit [Mycobacterium sp.]|nr:ABC transporter permease subunit [Mycobacterium sp.]